MKPSFAMLALLFSIPVAAQDVSTSFTLGTPTSNCIPVQTQDGVSTNGQGAVCPNGFFGGGGTQITLPNDPANPNNPLTIYTCTVGVISNTVPPYSATTPGPPGALVQGLSCPVEYSYFSTVWTGTLTYNYVSVRERHCIGGRGAHCVTAYYPVWQSGSGTLSTPQPPPPPPQPIVTTATITLQKAPCDATLVCQIVPTDKSIVSSATFDVGSSSLTITNADGSVSSSPLDSVQMNSNGDDGNSYTITGDGVLYDQAGGSNQTVEIQIVVASNDGGPFVVTSGTLSITTTTPP